MVSSSIFNLTTSSITLKDKANINSGMIGPFTPESLKEFEFHAFPIPNHHFRGCAVGGCQYLMFPFRKILSPFNGKCPHVEFQQKNVSSPRFTWTRFSVLLCWLKPAGDDWPAPLWSKITMQKASGLRSHESWTTEWDGLMGCKVSPWIRTWLGNLCYRKGISTGWFTRCQERMGGACGRSARISVAHRAHWS